MGLGKRRGRGVNCKIIISIQEGLAQHILLDLLFYPMEGNPCSQFRSQKGSMYLFSKKRACCRPKTGFPNGSLRMFDVVLVVTSVLCIYETRRALSRKFEVTDKQARGGWVIPENQPSVHPGLTDADPFPDNCLCMLKSAWCFHRVFGSWYLCAILNIR